MLNLWKQQQLNTTKVVARAVASTANAALGVVAASAAAATATVSK